MGGLLGGTCECYFLQNPGLGLGGEGGPRFTFHAPLKGKGPRYRGEAQTPQPKGRDQALPLPSDSETRSWRSATQPSKHLITQPHTEVNDSFATACNGIRIRQPKEWHRGI